MLIRKADLQKDYEAVWEIFREVIQSGDTYVFDPQTPKSDLKQHWFASYMHTYVLEDAQGFIQGTYILKPNQMDLGNHIANASYMIHPRAQGQGMGKHLCTHSIDLAKQLGYMGMQFNIVISTNTAAVALWKKHGFEIIGTTPGGFRHQRLGMVDTYIMFKALS